MSSWVDVLREPLLRGLDVEGGDRVARHAEILERKPLTRNVFEEFYRTCLALEAEHVDLTSGLRVELGAGVSFFKKLSPDLLVTDVAPARHIDRILDAQKMDLPDHSVRVMFGINCFHHFPNPRAFFEELRRVLIPGGACVLIEPAPTPLSSFIHRRLFSTEIYDPAAPQWSAPDRGVMRGANQALSTMVFRRDRAVYQREFADLPVVDDRPVLNGIRYLLSGGLNFKSLVPPFSARAIRFLEKAGSFVSPLWALHHAIVIKRANCSSGHLPE